MAEKLINEILDLCERSLLQLERLEPNYKVFQAPITNLVLTIWSQTMKLNRQLPKEKRTKITVIISLATVTSYYNSMTRTLLWDVLEEALRKQGVREDELKISKVIFDTFSE